MRLVSAMLTVEVRSICFLRVTQYTTGRNEALNQEQSIPLLLAQTVDENLNARTACHKAMSTWVLDGKTVRIAVHQGCRPSVF